MVNREGQGSSIFFFHFIACNLVLEAVLIGAVDFLG